MVDVTRQADELKKKKKETKDLNVGDCANLAEICLGGRFTKMAYIHLFMILFQI